MKGYALFQKGKKRPIRIALFTDQEKWVDVLIFATKRGLLASTNLEDDEEIRVINKVEDIFQ